MADSFSQHVYDTLSQKGDDELLAIWNEHDTETWSPAAFAAVERIAKERGIALEARDVGATTTGISPPVAGWIPAQSEAQPFSALIAVGRLFSISGWLFLVFGLVGCAVLFVMAVSSGSVQSVFLAVGMAALVFVLSIFLIAANDLVGVIISMEKQLRRIGDRLDTE